MYLFFRVLIILIMVSFAAPLMQARAEGLVGTVRVEAEDKGDSVNFKDGDREPPELKGQTAQIELRPPTWIEGKVFSNDDMKMYSFFVIAPFKKEWRWEIPSRKTTINMRPSVVRHWKGYKPEGQCPVICIPMGKGKFKFRHPTRTDGPHGYMERIGVTTNGFPQYRFWFDDEGSTGSTAESAKSPELPGPDQQSEPEKKSGPESSSPPE